MHANDPVSPRFPIATIGPRTVSSPRHISELLAVIYEQLDQMSTEPVCHCTPSSQAPRDKAA